MYTVLVFLPQVATASTTGELNIVTGTLDSDYRGVRSDCPEDCSVCEGAGAYFSDFSFIDGDVYIVGQLGEK